MQVPRKSTRLIELAEEVHDDATHGLADPVKTAQLLSGLCGYDVVISVVGSMLKAGAVTARTERLLREAAADATRLGLGNELEAA